jgi:hypothetical protein
MKGFMQKRLNIASFYLFFAILVTNQCTKRSIMCKVLPVIAARQRK